MTLAPPPPDQYVDWAYDFACSHSLESMLECFNQSGPWEWTLRESYVAGHYLSTRPSESTQVKLNEYPQAFMTGLRDAGFSILIRTSSQDRELRKQLDATVLGLLQAIDAEDIQSIEADG